LTISAFAQIPDRPNPNRLVNNLSVAFPNFLSHIHSKVSFKLQGKHT
jgi:hypothetical protein